MQHTAEILCPLTDQPLGTWNIVGMNKLGI